MHKPPWLEAETVGALIVDEHDTECYTHGGRYDPAGDGIRDEHKRLCTAHVEFYGGHCVLESCDEEDRTRVLAAVNATRFFSIELLRRLEASAVLFAFVSQDIVLDEKNRMSISVKRLRECADLATTTRALLDEMPADSNSAKAIFAVELALGKIYGSS